MRVSHYLSLASIGLSLLSSCASQSPDSGSQVKSGGKADAPLACEGAKLDQSEVCRLENGTFAPDACCDAEFGEDGTFDDSSGNGCIFGDHLVMMARMSDLQFSEAVTIDSGSEIAGIDLQQVLEIGFEPAGTLEEALEQTDEGEIDFIQVRDLAHRRNFNMYISYAGDTVIGRIFYAQSLRRAGEISDGSILDCDAAFSNYDDLPWFYTN